MVGVLAGAAREASATLPARTICRRFIPQWWGGGDGRESSPVVGEEVMASPVVVREGLMASPVVGEELMASPVMGEEMMASPVVVGEGLMAGSPRQWCWGKG